MCLHYLKEEVEHGAIAGSFTEPPITNLHVSPFMTRDKSSSEHRRVIIDLSWPTRSVCQFWGFFR